MASFSKLYFLLYGGTRQTPIRSCKQEFLMTHDFLSLSLWLSVAVFSKRLMPFILCLAVLAETGKTKGFRDVAPVFGPYRRRP